MSIVVLQLPDVKRKTTVYIIHQTLVIAVDILFVPMSIPTILKFVFVSIISVPLCFGLGILIRKIPYTQRVLG